MKKNIRLFTVNSIILLIIFCFVSCNKNDYASIGKDVVLNVNSSIVDFSNGGTLHNGENSNKSIDELEVLEDKIIQLNKKFLLRAELMYSVDDNAKSSLARQLDKQSSTNLLDQGITYRLLVYKTSDGSFVTSRNYIKGKEESSMPLKLDGGVEYTFIAYSLNNDANESVLQGVLKSTGNNSLTNSYLEILDDSNLLYFKTTKIISGEAEDILTIQFKPKFNYITVTLDASSTGYNVEGISAMLVSSNKTARLQLNTENITRIADNRTGTAVSFPSLNNSVVTSSPIVVNAGSGESLLEISRLQIGEIISTALLKPFDAIKVALKPGFKYTLYLTVVSNDKYLECDNNGENCKAVSINGNIWMRHNLGATSSANPDVLSEEIHGDFYQFGGSVPFMNKSGIPYTGLWSNSPVLTNVNWNNSKTGNNADTWDEDPNKGTADPCPAGYRVPTRREIESLVTSTKVQNTVWTGDHSNSYGGGIVLFSKRNSSVKFTIPAQGYYTFQMTNPVSLDANKKELGVGSYFWSSLYQRNQSRSGYFKASELSNIAYVGQPAGSNYLLEGYPIRCIKQRPIELTSN